MAGRFCGHSDPRLNERGRLQTVTLVTELRGRRIEVVYSSDLERAAMTAEAIAMDYGVSCELRPGLREVYFGAWEGLSWEEVEARDRAYAERWVNMFPELPAPGGETFAAFRARVLGDLREVLALAGGRRAVVVAHAGVLRLVLREMCGATDEIAWERTKNYCCRIEGAEVRL